LKQSDYIKQKRPKPYQLRISAFVSGSFGVFNQTIGDF